MFRESLKGDIYLFQKMFYFLIKVYTQKIRTFIQEENQVS